MKDLNLFQLDSLLFQVDEVTANDESSKYLFSQKVFCIDFGKMKFVWFVILLWISEHSLGLNFMGVDFFALPGSSLVWSSDLVRFEDGSVSSLSSEGGADC